MRKLLQKSMACLLVGILVLTGIMFENGNSFAAYASNSEYLSDFTLKAGTTTYSNCIESFSTEEEKGLNVFFPDTGSAGAFLYAKVGQTGLYYKVEPGIESSKTGPVSSNGMLNKFVTSDIKFFQLPVGTTGTLTMTVGKGKELDDSQTYKVYAYKKVMLSGLSVMADAETPLELNAKWDMVNDGKTYSVSVSEDVETVTLTCTPRTALASYDEAGKLTAAGTRLSYGTATDAVVSAEKTTATFTIDQLPKTTDGKRYIPITLDYVVASEGGNDIAASQNVKESTYTLLIERGNYVPEVKLLNEKTEYSYDRGVDTEPLSVKYILEEGSEGKISYQWYRQSSGVGDFVKIDGANEANYTPSSEYVHKDVYRCEVMNTVSGVPHSAFSDTITVISLPTSASKPVITKEPENITCSRGSEQKLVIEAKSNDYLPDVAVGLSYQWYSKSEPNGEKTCLKGETGQIFSVPTDKLGTFYYCCVVTSTIAEFSAEQESRTAEIQVTEIPGIDKFKGSGTKETPYLISNIGDLNNLKDIVNGGQGCEGIYFQLTASLELPENWEQIGALKDPSKETEDAMLSGAGTDMGENVNPFMGIFDGNDHTITIPENGMPLFKYVRKATIKNLNIKGTKIAASALVSHAFIDYGEDGKYATGVPWTVLIDHVTLKSGSSAKYSGFLPGSGSGANTVTIQNSKIEKDVLIGEAGTKVANGSFTGTLNGKIRNCISYATVYGAGGLAGTKGQSMGDCSILNSAFIGTVNSNTFAGGIIGSGYNGYGSDGVNSAPNTPVVSVQNCYVAGNISGKGAVGGIMGTEPSCECCWSNGVGTISNNHFYGTLNETSGTGHVGGIVGFMKSFNKYQSFENNYYVDSCGAKTGIGEIETIITKEHPKYGAGYGFDYNFDQSAVCIAATDKQFKNNDIAAKLNGGTYSAKNWKQGEKYPELASEPIICELTLGGDYKTTYAVGEPFSTDGMTITGIYTNGNTKKLSIDELEFSGFSSSRAGDFEVKVRYQVAETSFTVRIRYANPKPAKVSITILGDTAHGDPTKATGTHTLRSNNLPQQWYTGSFDVNQNSTVWDILQLVTKDTKGKISFSNPSGNYVDYVTYNGLKLGEFTNGKLSGWMYTLNGTHPNLGVSEQFLNPGDRIVWHYTDDYTKEEGSDKWGTPGADEVKDVTTSGAAGSASTTAPTEVKVSGTTATATIKAENQSEILKQAAEKKSAEIILEVSKADSKGADSVQLSLDVTFVKNVADKTNADLTVNTENGKVTLDQETIKTVLAEAKGATITLEVSKVSKPTEVQKKAAGANGDIFSLLVKSGDKIISNFNKGKATVTVEIPTKLQNKKVAAIYIAEDGKIEQMAGKTVKIDGKDYYIFETPHFSTFALVDADELGLEVNDEEANIVKIKELVSDMSLKARSSKTSKKNIKVTLTVDKSTAAAIKEIKDMGYTVKYKYYRSTKKASKYQAKITKTTKSYTNTAGKKGTRYYYKARIQVYDKDGKLVAQTALKQCKYAARTWTK